MKNHKLNLVIAAGFLASFAVACSMFSGTNTSENGNKSAATNSGGSATPVPAAVDCPSGTLSVKEVKGDIKKYEGCTLSVRGQLWEVRKEFVDLMDTDERLNPSIDSSKNLGCSGNFSGSTYTDIETKLRDLRSKSQFDKFPVATFTGTVKTTDGYTGLRDCVLTNVQR